MEHLVRWQLDILFKFIKKEFLNRVFKYLNHDLIYTVKKDLVSIFSNPYN